MKDRRSRVGLRSRRSEVRILSGVPGFSGWRDRGGGGSATGGCSTRAANAPSCGTAPTGMCCIARVCWRNECQSTRRDVGVSWCTSWSVMPMRPSSRRSRLANETPRSLRNSPFRSPFVTGSVVRRISNLASIELADARRRKVAGTDVARGGRSADDDLSSASWGCFEHFYSMD